MCMDFIPQLENIHSIQKDILPWIWQRRYWMEFCLWLRNGCIFTRVDLSHDWQWQRILLFRYSHNECYGNCWKFSLPESMSRPLVFDGIWPTRIVGYTEKRRNLPIKFYINVQKYFFSRGLNGFLKGLNEIPYETELKSIIRQVDTLMLTNINWVLLYIKNAILYVMVSNFMYFHREN